MPTFLTPSLSGCSSLLRAAVLAGLLAALSACGEGEQANVVQQDEAQFSSAEQCEGLDPSKAEVHWVTSWRTAPTDALITHPISGLSVRQSLAPHRSGQQLRLRLSNRYSNLPVTLDQVHIAKEAQRGGAAMVPGSECLLLFAGQTRVTIPAGATVVSDAIHYPLKAFERVGISFFAPTLTPQFTRHLNAAEFLYMSLPGDHAADPSGAVYIQVPDSYASNFVLIEALEVLAPQNVRTIVAVGDSITDGSASTTVLLDGGVNPMTGTDQRYPNHLQRRIDAAGLPLTVANAGIGGNELLSDAWLPQFGRSLLDRLDYDVLGVTGASHVLAMIGTNDFGNPKAGGMPSAEDLIAGLQELIRRTQDAGLKIVLGTIPPAEGTVIEGLPLIGGLPLGVGVLHGTAQARASRDAVNAWIREQDLSDGIVDFDTCLEDPQRPGYLAPEYNSGDNLHPSPAGYAAMADCVDLNLFL